MGSYYLQIVIGVNNQVFFRVFFESLHVIERTEIVRYALVLKRCSRFQPADLQAAKGVDDNVISVGRRQGLEPQLIVAAGILFLHILLERALDIGIFLAAVVQSRGQHKKDGGRAEATAP